MNIFNGVDIEKTGLYLNNYCLNYIKVLLERQGCNFLGKY